MENPPIFKFGKPSISMGHLSHGYVSHNQMVCISLTSKNSGLARRQWSNFPGGAVEKPSWKAWETSETGNTSDGKHEYLTNKSDDNMNIELIKQYSTIFNHQNWGNL